MASLAYYQSRLDSTYAQWRKSIFIYPGAKSSALAKEALLSAFPSAFSEYREPFVGGGSVAMMIPLTTRRWINDINPMLIAVYRALQERPVEFIADMAKYVSTDVAANRRTFTSMIWDEGIDPAIRFLFLNRFSYNGMVRLQGHDWRYRTTFSEERGYAFFQTRRLEEAAEVVRAMKITCGDYAQLFTEPGQDVFVYADAPYVVDTRSHDSARLYDYSFASLADHHRLRDIATASPHKVMLSYDDEPIIRSLYKSWRVRGVQWRYMGGRKRMGRELIITNYDP